MPRGRRSPSSDAASSRSRSRGRRGRRQPSESRSRSRGGKRASGGGGGDSELRQWDTAGVVIDLKPSGFGFIRPNSGKVNDKDLYFHCTAVNRNTPFDELRVQDEVTYEVVRDEKKGAPVAKNITRVGSGGGSRGGGRKSKRDDSRSDSRDRRRR
mmetsp:Transcript_53554/g.83379  ORF Transcript_53554/g.83379 Transcript_53554/m.83379 type:complete len:155 (+) Transcript_53554:50-514(+)